MNKLFILIIFLLVIAPKLLFADSKIVIIVNKENSLTNVAYDDLVKIFKQDKKYWPDGKKIYLAMHESGSIEKKFVLEKIYKMNEQDLKKFWLSKIFKGDIESFPKTFASNDSMKIFVNRVTGAVGYITEEALDDTVKVLKVEGI